MVFRHEKTDGTCPCRWRRRKEARPEEIIDAALVLFAEKGFAATRMTDVAKKAGISKGTLYLYFENKEAIFRKAVQEILIPIIEEKREFVENYTGSASELLANMLREWWKTMSDRRLSAIPKIITSESGNFPEMAKFFTQAVVSRSREMIARVIEYGINSGEFKPCNPVTASRLVSAPLVYNVIWMHSLKVYDEYTTDHSRSDEEFLELHIELFLKGLSR